MMKHILATAIAAAVVIPAASAATNNVTVYGKVDVAITKASRKGLADPDAPATNYDRPDDWFVHENGGASKLGFKGSEDLGNGLKGIWKMEFDIPIGRTTNGKNNQLSGGGAVNSNRNAYIGLAGDWGTALIGRHDTPYKMAFGKWDLFADTISDFNNGNMAGFHDPRGQDAIAYVSPNFNGLSFAGAIITGSASENGVTSGNEKSIADHYSIAANYNNNGIMAAIAYEKLDKDTIDRLSGAVLGDPKFGKDVKKWGGALGYKMNGFFVGGRYDNYDRDPASPEEKSKIYGLWGSYDFNNFTVKATYQRREQKTEAGVKTKPNAWAIGGDYNFSKRTRAYAIYTQTDYKDTDSAGTKLKDNFFSVGMRHSF